MDLYAHERHSEVIKEGTFSGTYFRDIYWGVHPIQNLGGKRAPYLFSHAIFTNVEVNPRNFQNV